MSATASLTHIGHLRVAEMTHLIGYLHARAEVQEAEGKPSAAAHTRGAMAIVHAQRAALIDQLTAVDDACAVARFMQLERPALSPALVGG